MKKCLVLMLAVVLAGALCGGAFADYHDQDLDGDSWEGAYLISNATDFMDMRNNAYGETGKYYKLTTDLDLRTETNFGYSVFRGHFDGQNHTVNVYIQDTESGRGLFYEVESDSTAIMNLNVTGTVSGANVTGGIVQTLRSGTVANCSFTGTVEDVRTTDYNYSISAGGIVGHMGSFEGSSAVTNCTFSGTVRASGVNDAHATGGGIVGAMHSGTIQGCDVLSDSVVESSWAAGGIAGEVAVSWEDAEDGITYIQSCSTYATLSGSAANKGGVAGYVVDSSRANFSSNVWPSEYSETGYGGNGGSTVPDQDSEEGNSGTTVSADLPSGIVESVTLSSDVLESVAQAVSADVSQIRYVTEENISAPEDPTPAMTDYVQKDNHEITGKLGVLSVDIKGYYVFKVTLTDELYEVLKDKSTSNFKFYALGDGDSAEVSASIFNGLLSTWELLTMNGEKLDSFGVREFLMVGMLEASKPLSLYIARIILMLLMGGCNSGIGIAGALPVVLAGLLFVKLMKH